MSDRDELEQWIDDYTDGALDEERARRLLESLASSDEARDRLAASLVVERLLRAQGRGAVDTRRIMKAVTAAAAPANRTTSTGPARSIFWALTLLLALAGAVFWLLRDKPTAVDPARPEPAARTEPPAATQTMASAETPEAIPEIETPPPAAIPEASLYRPFPLEPPPPLSDEDLRPPAGDGSDEPGFVPPPPEWLAEKPAVPSAGDPGAAAPGLAAAEGQRDPAPPLLWVKLRLGERRRWAATPRDLTNLFTAVRSTLGIDYGTGEQSLDEIGEDPSAHPVLYLTSHYHFVFTPAQRATLRRFMLAGGMMVFEAGLGSKPAYDSARRELRLIFPEIPIERLNDDHPIFHAFYDAARDEPDPEKLPWFEGVTLSCRTAAVVSRWGLSAGWTDRWEATWQAYRPEEARKLGINLVSYAAAARAWVKRASFAAAFADWEASPSARLFVTQVIHEGTWRTRYTALPVLLHTFNQRTEVPVRFRVKAMRLTDPGLYNEPMLYLTGHEPLRLSAGEIEALRGYLENGGFLFAEACCGRAAFDRSFRMTIRRVFPDRELETVPPTDVLFREPNPITILGVTPSLAAKAGSMLIRPRLEGIRVGASFGVIYSPYGLAGGWEMSQMPYADGYEDPDSLKLGQNILLYAITQ